MSTHQVQPTVDGRGNEEMVLPWWFSWWRVGLLSVAATLAATSLAFALRPKSDNTPDLDGVDVGFLQDMRIHHGQAIEMSMTFRDLDGVNPALRQIATEIVLGQSYEVGAMSQAMIDMGAPFVIDQGDGEPIAMAWMGAPVPAAEMPGMATQANLDALADASGADADRLFAQLMSAHHEGGVTMAQHAAQHAERSGLREIAELIASTQQGEIEELSRFF